MEKTPDVFTNRFAKLREAIELRTKTAKLKNAPVKKPTISEVREQLLKQEAKTKHG